MKPILFNTEMVRAILDGRKTQTRRVVKPGHLRVLTSEFHRTHPDVPDASLIKKLCLPPYEPGEILYVRETWRVQSAKRFDSTVLIDFKAGGIKSMIHFPGGQSQGTNRDEYDAFVARWMQGDGWKPSIHMPKEAARLFLRVMDVRVERLQEITEDGAKSEGCERGPSLLCPYISSFLPLWDGTIKPAKIDLYGWDANPFVWVIEFQRGWKVG